MRKSHSHLVLKPRSHTRRLCACTPESRSVCNEYMGSSAMYHGPLVHLDPAPWMSWSARGSLMERLDGPVFRRRWSSQRGFFPDGRAQEE